MPDAVEQLRPLFEPRNIAFLGASGDFAKLGTRILGHILMGKFPGGVHPVHSKEKVLGLAACPTIERLPRDVDLAILAIPARGVPEALENLGAAGVPAAIVISSGFAEAGEAALQEEAVSAARRTGVRFLGPNCMGVFSAPVRLHATLPPLFPAYGDVSVLSQSGGIGTVTVEGLGTRLVGCRFFASTGNEASVRTEDVLEYFARDPGTRVVLGFVEGVREGRRFYDLCRGLGKPFVLLKGGKSEAGRGAAASHTGSLAGSPEVFEAVFRQANVVLVDGVGDLLETGIAFAKQPLPRGKRVAVVTSGGGGGVVCADICARYGLDMPPLSPEVVARMSGFLPAYWSRNNPVDITADAVRDFLVYVKCAEALLASDACDGLVLVLLVGMIHKLTERYKGLDLPPGMPPPAAAGELLYAAELDLARRLGRLAPKYGKPVLSVCPMAPYSALDPKVRAILSAMAQGGVTTHVSPEDAIGAFQRMWMWAERSPRLPG